MWNCFTGPAIIIIQQRSSTKNAMELEIRWQSFGRSSTRRSGVTVKYNAEAAEFASFCQKTERSFYFLWVTMTSLTASKSHNTRSQCRTTKVTARDLEGDGIWLFVIKQNVSKTGLILGRVSRTKITDRIIWIHGWDFMGIKKGIIVLKWKSGRCGGSILGKKMSWGKKMSLGKKMRRMRRMMGLGFIDLYFFRIKIANNIGHNIWAL